jgi:hypothetical protein
MGSILVRRRRDWISNTLKRHYAKIPLVSLSFVAIQIVPSATVGRTWR